MFWANLKEILKNSPLVLSDTYDPKDVSQNRLAFFILFLFVISTPLLLLWLAPHLSEKFVPYWQGSSALLGGQMFANIGKKAITAYQEMKGSEKQ